MKKLLSVFCCVLCMRNFSQAPADVMVSSSKSSGEKVLVKAISAIINREGKRKTPVKKIDLPSSGKPEC